MLANRSTDTKPEIALRRALHARGLRFRKAHRLDLADRRVRPDVVFPKAKVAVFLDGCFWHRCPTHATTPARNSEYWREKFRRNVARDRAVDRSLAAEGWTCLRIWEHENLQEAVARVVSAVRGDDPARYGTGRRQKPGSVSVGERVRAAARL